MILSEDKLIKSSIFKGPLIWGLVLCTFTSINSFNINKNSFVCVFIAILPDENDEA